MLENSLPNHAELIRIFLIVHHSISLPSPSFFQNLRIKPLQLHEMLSLGWCHLHLEKKDIVTWWFQRAICIYDCRAEPIHNLKTKYIILSVQNIKIKMRNRFGSLKAALLILQPTSTMWILSLFACYDGKNGCWMESWTVSDPLTHIYTLTHISSHN